MGIDEILDEKLITNKPLHTFQTFHLLLVERDSKNEDPKKIQSKMSQHYPSRQVMLFQGSLDTTLSPDESRLLSTTTTTSSTSSSQLYQERRLSRNKAFSDFLKQKQVVDFRISGI